MIALNSPLKPDINKLQHYLKTINNNGWLTNFGPLEQELTDRLSRYLGVEHLLLVNNGTSALQVAAQTLGLEKIITTPFTFVATTSSFAWQKKKISFADIDINSFNLSPSKVIDALKAPFSNDENINGIVATHVYGNPCDVEAFNNIQRTNNIKIIYDAAHAFGIKINNNSVLNYGDASILSFHATKLFHTAEGGAIVFKNKASLLRAKSLINFGFQNGEHSGLIGINAKLNEYQAAIGLVNLDIIDSVIGHRVALYELYLTELNSAVQFSTWHKEANYNGAYMAIYFASKINLTAVTNALTNEKIEHRKYFESVDLLLNYKCDLANSHKISEGILCLPLHVYLTKNDVLNICSVIKSALLKNL
jgi:dTDP-4-amino-4,6-dideoxygalactose transaminase